MAGCMQMISSIPGKTVQAIGRREWCMGGLGRVLARGLGRGLVGGLGRGTAALLTTVLATSQIQAATSSYRVTFESIWSAATHPQDYPPGAHYSPLVGGTHNANVSFWEPGGIATDGIRSMAETGGPTILVNEVQTAVSAGHADARLLGPQMATTPGSVQMTFELDDQFPLVTLVTMIAPSPDWFVGVHGLPLFENGEWIGKTVIDLRPYDAGTDSGVTFTSANAVTSPREPIHELSDTFPFQGTGPLGTFTFLRLVNGDLNESGDLDVGDLDDLSQALREDRTESRWDVNGDQQVNGQDRIYWIEQLRGSTFGDANLDGQFNSGDLLTVFQAGQYRDNVVGNSGWMQGDWDGDGEFDTSDLLVAFQRGGYEVAGATAVASVPEPSALFLTATGIGLLAVRRRRSMAAGTRTIN